MGELCIAGDGLARGYLNRAEMTQTRFVPNPFTPEEKIYKTGDLAKWLPDGNIEFIGRKDHQVKIRGFRIELNEIEIQLLKHEIIKEAIVIDRLDNKQNRYLAAYLILDAKKDDKISISEIREFLAKSLPAYMIPSHFMILDEFPLSPTGKINRRALPEPDQNLLIEKEYVAPQNDIEEKLSHIWSDILGMNRVGIDDNFFELGGHSLKATQFVSGEYIKS